MTLHRRWLFEPLFTIASPNSGAVSNNDRPKYVPYVEEAEWESRRTGRLPKPTSRSTANRSRQANAPSPAAQQRSHPPKSLPRAGCPAPTRRISKQKAAQAATARQEFKQKRAGYAQKLGVRKGGQVHHANQNTTISSKSISPTLIGQTSPKSSSIIPRFARFGTVTTVN